jgi:hypothetical protein
VCIRETVSRVRIPSSLPEYKSNEIKSPQTQCLRAFSFLAIAQNVHKNPKSRA